MRATSPQQHSCADSRTEGFGDALALVVATAHTNRIDGAPVPLGLGMNLRIAIHLTGAGQKQPRSHPPRQAQHVVGAKKAGLGRFDRVELIVNRRGRAGQMPDPVDLQLDRLDDIVTDELEAGMANPARDVGLTPGEVVVHTDHLITGLHQSVDQVRAKETGTAGDEVDLHPQGVAVSPGSR